MCCAAVSKPWPQPKRKYINYWDQRCSPKTRTGPCLNQAHNILKGKYQNPHRRAERWLRVNERGWVNGELRDVCAHTDLTETLFQPAEVQDEAQLLSPAVEKSHQAMQHLVHPVVQSRYRLHRHLLLFCHAHTSEPRQRGTALLLQLHQTAVFKDATHLIPVPGEQQFGILGNTVLSLGWCHVFRVPTFFLKLFFRTFLTATVWQTSYHTLLCNYFLYFGLILMLFFVKCWLFHYIFKVAKQHAHVDKLNTVLFQNSISLKWHSSLFHLCNTKYFSLSVLHKLVS